MKFGWLFFFCNDIYNNYIYDYKEKYIIECKFKDKVSVWFVVILVSFLFNNDWRLSVVVYINRGDYWWWSCCGFVSWWNGYREKKKLLE